MFSLMASGATINGYNVYELVSNPKQIQAAIESYQPLFNTGQLVPTVDLQSFSLEQLVEVFTFFESNDQFGKVVIEF